MSDELYAVWRNIKPGPHYAPYEISALKAEVVRLRSENAKLRLPSQAGEGGVAEELHPATTDLVDRFAAELKSKLAKAEAKYGYAADWLNPDWQSELIESLAEHIHKGDPRDVAAYCAFAWHHGWPVSGAVDCFSRSFSPHAENDQSTTTPPSDPRLDRAIEALETIDAGGADVAPPANKRSYSQGFDQGTAWAGRVARQALASIRGEA